MTATRYPTIRNCNFSSREDDRGRHVHEAILAADRGCEDCNLIGALDDLEATLADHAESDSEESMRLCREAEEAVESAFLAPVARHEERPVEGIGWYVYVGGQDAGGPFETEADALAHWQK